MYGEPDNAAIWGDADVFVSDDLNARRPDTLEEDFDASWGLVGLLDGAAGFVESRSEDTVEVPAWGRGIIRTKKRNFSLTRKFTALETNPVVMALLWPGSTPTKRRIPRPHKFLIGFQTTDGEHTRRLISSYYAEVTEVEDITETEEDVTKYGITVRIYANQDGDLWDVYDSATIAGAGELVALQLNPATKALKVGEYSAPLVATATYSDQTTRNVSHLVSWATLAAATATVDHGYVHGVKVGTAKVTATLKGQTAVCDVTVSA